MNDTFLLHQFQHVEEASKASEKATRRLQLAVEPEHSLASNAEEPPANYEDMVSALTLRVKVLIKLLC